ncbi:MAG: acyl-CoA thioester hydrolase/BAAT C-terminal domain-containing protein [Ktedonobacterales bacterium]
MSVTEEPLSGRLQGAVLRPVAASERGVIVLAGSSGRVDVERARLLARHGALALALRWFGGSDQPSGICEIALETFTAAVDWLYEQGVRHVGLVGVSKGAEAVLLVACRDERVDAVTAISPSSVAWANVGPGRDGAAYPYRSSWTWRGAPLPFVPYDETWTPAASDGPIAYRSLYEQSLRAFPAAATAASIPVEHARANLLLVAGADDQMWPSETFAAALATRRRMAGRQVEVVSDVAAGHRPYFPGEAAPAPPAHSAHGGSVAADGALGAAAWPRVLALLGPAQ